MPNDKTMYHDIKNPNKKIPITFLPFSGSEFRKDEKSRMHGGEGGEEIKKGFYFGKNTCQVQTSGAL